MTDISRLPPPELGNPEWMQNQALLIKPAGPITQRPKSHEESDIKSKTVILDVYDKLVDNGSNTEWHVKNNNNLPFLITEIRFVIDKKYSGSISSIAPLRGVGLKFEINPNINIGNFSINFEHGNYSPIYFTKDNKNETREQLFNFGTSSTFENLTFMTIKNDNHDILYGIKLQRPYTIYECDWKQNEESLVLYKKYLNNQSELIVYLSENNKGRNKIHLLSYKLNGSRDVQQKILHYGMPPNIIPVNCDMDKLKWNIKSVDYDESDVNGIVKNTVVGGVGEFGQSIDFNILGQYILIALLIVLIVIISYLWSITTINKKNNIGQDNYNGTINNPVTRVYTGPCQLPPKSDFYPFSYTTFIQRM